VSSLCLSSFLACSSGRFSRYGISKDIFIADSLFYSKLRDDGRKSMKKWFKGVDLCKKKVILFPINEAEHFSVAAIVNPKAALAHDEDYGLTILFHMDSCEDEMLHTTNTIISKLVDWLSAKKKWQNNDRIRVTDDRVNHVSFDRLDTGMRNNLNLCASFDWQLLF